MQWTYCFGRTTLGFCNFCCPLRRGGLAVWKYQIAKHLRNSGIIFCQVRRQWDTKGLISEMQQGGALSSEILSEIASNARFLLIQEPLTEAFGAITLYPCEWEEGIGNCRKQFLWWQKWIKFCFLLTLWSCKVHMRKRILCNITDNIPQRLQHQNKLFSHITIKISCFHSLSDWKSQMFRTARKDIRYR